MRIIVGTEDGVIGEGESAEHDYYVRNRDVPTVDLPVTSVPASCRISRSKDFRASRTTQC